MGDREVCREVLLKSMAFAKFAVGNNNTNAVQYNTPPMKRIWFYVLKMLAFCIHTLRPTYTSKFDVFKFLSYLKIE